jgi:hypothetical protein
MAGRLELIDYVGDNGVTVQWPQDVSNAVAAGNTHTSVTVGPAKGMRPRYILARHPTTGRQRKIVIGNPTNPLWLGSGAGSGVITLPDFDATMDPTVYVVQGRMGERRFAPHAT